jgi:hypothetical protein
MTDPAGPRGWHVPNTSQILANPRVEAPPLATDRPIRKENR